MLEVKQIENGIVIDHIKSGNGLKIFNKLLLHESENPVVLLMNVESKALGRKDIIKIENTLDVDLNLLGLIDENITINYIKNGKLYKKEKVSIPTNIKSLIKCKNPRCITNSDIYAKPSFKLISKENLEYKCLYCEEITKYEL
ncbi:aspartate carbamoyltransferase regulatory subunit [Caminicella sporogenes DSM 14501]|uniref:Aspartate carbamoyltransferase regulatory subunit n=1 Tax=Caminicella sporogenes DSM 14501 TaxID=1121266 RepID=A0A1M6QW26_9FIRM|nr:aspartate carbamoyltransferase regulatory subunit [Caminicella sporogenes]RKD20886.1 aspartate carbamoyltransferase regulatory subunit [Caminicella sporogenes]WIF95718.1 aspartate carbamoyltransferase regulatory subunit [Caminicella sporogenes]SHK24441.1 aspartate carbamoyltransferase regulatory subunit [Caminicella sporogenes DSM 14501]